MPTFRLTKLFCVFSILAVALVAAAAIGFPSAIDQYAPFESTTSECLICGRMRTVERRWMQSPAESIYVGDDSLWMQPQVDSEHDHWWAACSTEERPGWFDYSMIGCGGGVGGVSTLHHVATNRGADVAQPLVNEYLQLTQGGDLKSVRNFVQYRVMPALQDRPRAPAVAQ